MHHMTLTFTQQKILEHVCSPHLLQHTDTCKLHLTARALAAEMKQSCDRLGSICRPHLVLRGNALQEVNVFLTVEIDHVLCSSLPRHVRLHARTNDQNCRTIKQPQSLC